jgi:hypothetical protein
MERCDGEVWRTMHAGKKSFQLKSQWEMPNCLGTVTLASLSVPY